MAEYIYNVTDPRDEPVTFASDRLPYRVVVPPGWGIAELANNEAQFDVFTSEDTQQSIAVAFFLALPGVYEDTETTFLQGKRVESVEPVTVGSLEARLYRWNEHHLFGKDKRGLHVVFVDRVFVWHVMVEAEAGAPDEGLFREFLGSFAPSEVLFGADDRSGNIWALEPGDCFRSLPLSIQPGKVVEFWGGVDGFEKVADRDVPHTGMVAMKFSELPKDFKMSFEDPAMGALLCLPMPGRDHPPADVVGLLVLAHAAGPYTGPYDEGEEPPNRQ